MPVATSRTHTKKSTVIAFHACLMLIMDFHIFLVLTTGAATLVCRIAQSKRSGEAALAVADEEPTHTYTVRYQA